MEAKIGLETYIGSFLYRGAPASQEEFGIKKPRVYSIMARSEAVLLRRWSRDDGHHSIRRLSHQAYSRCCFLNGKVINTELKMRPKKSGLENLEKYNIRISRSLRIFLFRRFADSPLANLPVINLHRRAPPVVFEHP